MKIFKLRQRVTRTRVNGGKLPEFERLRRPLWIRRVLVRAQEGQLEGPIPFRWIGPFRLCARSSRFCDHFSSGGQALHQDPMVGPNSGSLPSALEPDCIPT